MLWRQSIHSRSIFGVNRLLRILLFISFGTSDVQGFSSSPRNSDYKWLIVGGGLHGVHVAARLKDAGQEMIGIADDAPYLLYNWKRRTENTGMTFLRSSSSHHLDIPVDSLRNYAIQHHEKKGKSKKKKKKKKATVSAVLNDRSLFAADYHRPSLRLFNQHCDHVMNKYGLQQHHARGKVEEIIPHSNHVKVNIGGNWVTAENIVLCLGSDDPKVPEWIEELPFPLRHVLDTTKKDGPDETQSKVCVIIGGGISAVHKALHLIAADATSTVVVHIISRHSLREQQFDTNQDWMMDAYNAQRSIAKGGKGYPDRVKEFQQQPCPNQRRAIIRRERVPGTIPTALSRGKGGLQEAIRKGSIQWHVGEVERCETNWMESSTITDLLLSTGDTISNVDTVIAATGFGTNAPGQAIIQDLSARYNLSLSPCGYPLVNDNLQWQGHSRIFCAGALAELELGPSARNLAGARMSSERIVATVDAGAIRQ